MEIYEKLDNEFKETRRRTLISLNGLLIPHLRTK
jgi:hypothetical protein